MDEPFKRTVANVGLLGGVVSYGRLYPEFAFTADVGVRYRGGVGLVAFVHGHVTGLLNRYGIGAAVRFGDRSHLIVGMSMGVAGSGVVSLVVRGAIVLAKCFTLLFMPTLSTNGQGVIASFSAGAGLTY